ncbi:uncharacterized protein [Medicago truncatula]|uniref:uncharacterized protein n=1 Tax=Medicago truncatula TaxID=3880 RepID=UPI000D2F1C5F|nr:uncharacterized protein LOC112420956 [Medicago truncatula]
MNSVALNVDGSVFLNSNLGGFGGLIRIIQHVVCHSDSTTVVDLVQKDLNVHHKYGNFIMAIKQLLRRDWVVSLRHTLCEGNAAADFLAKKGALSDSCLVILNEAPPDIASILLADTIGVEFVRP